MEMEGATRLKVGHVLYDAFSESGLCRGLGALLSLTLLPCEKYNDGIQCSVVSDVEIRLGQGVLYGVEGYCIGNNGRRDQ